MGRRYVRDNRGRFASTGATARGGRLRTEAGNKRETQTMQVKGGGSKLRNRNQAALHNAASRGDKSALAALRAQRKGPLKPARKDTKDQGWGTGLDQGGAPKRAYAKPPANTLKNQTGSSKTLNKFNSRPERTRGAYVGGRYVDKAKLTGRQPLDLGRGDDRAYGRVATKSAKARAKAGQPSDRKAQLIAGAAKRNAQADKIDARIRSLEKEYRSKDAAFYTQGVKPASRDRMIAKSRQAAELRQQSAALREKSANAQRMANKIKPKPAKAATSADPRMARALRNEAAGSTSYRRNPKGYQKRITALTAQKVYSTGDVTAGLSVAKMAGRGFRLPRSSRR